MEISLSPPLRAVRQAESSLTEQRTWNRIWHILDAIQMLTFTEVITGSLDGDI